MDILMDLDHLHLQLVFSKLIAHMQVEFLVSVKKAEHDELFHQQSISVNLQYILVLQTTFHNMIHI